jgi:hypothetical protein
MAKRISTSVGLLDLSAGKTTTVAQDLRVVWIPFE